jgi:hypothetical protein
MAKWSRWKDWLKRRLARKRKPEAPPPADPYADRLVPVRRGPKGRSGAAVAEPEEDFR